MATHEDIVEQTLQDLLQAVKDLNPNQNNQPASSTSTATVTKKTNIEMSKFADGFVKTSKTIGNAVASGITKPAGMAGKAVGSLGNAAVKTVSSLYSFSKSLDTQSVKLFESSLTDSTAKLTTFTNKFDILPIFGSTLKSLGVITQSNVDVFRELTSVGADFGKGITSFRNSAAEAGLSVDDFRKVVTKNSETFALFAGNVATGTQRFVEISKAIQKQYTPAFSKLGFTMGELSEYTAGYIELQTRLGRAQNMTVPELVEGTKQYILELDQLSRVTGLSRKQIEEQQRKAMQDVRIKTLMASLDAKAQGELKNSLTLLSSLPAEYSKYADAIKELIATGGIPITELAKGIAATTPGVYKAATALGKGAGSADELAAAVREVAENGKHMSKEAAQMANIFATKGNDLAFAATTSAIGLDKFGLDIKTASAEQQEALARANNAVLAIDKTFQDFRDRIMMSVTPILEKFGSSLARVVNFGMPYFDKLFKKLGEIYDKIAPKFDKMLEKFGKILIGSLPNLEKWFDKFLNILGDTVPGILDSLLDFMTGLPDTTGSILGSLGRFMSDLAKHTPNISKWLSDMVSGFSETIPKVVKWFKDLGSELEIRAPRLRQDILDLATSFDNNVPAIRKWIEELPGKLEEFSNVIIPAITSGLKLFTLSVDNAYKFFTDENFRKQVLFSIIDGFSTLLQSATPYVLAGLDKLKIILSDYWTFNVLPVLQDALYSLKNTLISYAAGQWELMWDSLGEYLSETWLNFKKEHFSLFVTDDDLKEVTNRKDRNKEVRELHKKQLKDDLDAAESKRKRERDADLQREKENRSRKTHIENQESFDQRVKNINKSIADSLQSLKDTLGNIIPGTAPNAGVPSEMPLGAGDVEAPAGGISNKNAAIAMKFLQNKGWTKEQAASIVGNLMGESGVSTTALDYIQRGRVAKGLPIQESKAHYGIAQWDKTRRDRFEKMFGTRVEHAPLEKQLEYLDWELKNTESRAGRNLRMTRTLEGGTSLFMREFERPHKKEQAKSIGARLKFARQAYSLGDPGAIPATTGTVPVDAGASIYASTTGKPFAGEADYKYLSSKRTRAGVYTNELNRDFAARLTAMMRAAEKEGHKIGISSAFRTAEHQAKIRAAGERKYGSKAGLRTAKHSQHTRGTAADLAWLSPGALRWAHEHAAEYGMHFPLMYTGALAKYREDWHIEPKWARVGGIGSKPTGYTPDQVPVWAGGKGTKVPTPTGGTMLASAKTAGGESTNISPTAAQPVSGAAAGATTGISELSTTLLTATNTKLDLINTNMEKLIVLSTQSNEVGEKILTATKRQKNNLLPVTV